MCLVCLSKQLGKLAMLILLALLLLCYGAENVYCVHDNSTDLHSLLDFKQDITNDPNEALSSWNTDTHYCRWKYVTCTQTRPWRVSGLNLTGQSLSGSVTTSLGNLTFLNTLDLSVNNLFGQIPPLHQLQQLKILVLKNNLLQGIIPDTLTNCSNLSTLDLSGNMLVGAIPRNIGFLSNLQVLNLGSNNLTGTIPLTLKNITNLGFLLLYTNKLKGNIPDELWELPHTAALFLFENRLSGSIPSTLPNLTSLQVLDLHSNMLGKELPSNIGDALSNLVMLDVHHNIFEGQIPASFGNAKSLEIIDLSENYFTGQIPSTFGKLVYLNYLNLQTNNLGAEDNQNWEFLEALSSCRLLQALSLFNNQLQGVLPDSIGKLPTGLQKLDLSTNNLSGTVPSSIGKLIGLNTLDLSKNNFTGSIEEWVGSLTNLQGLNLDANKFIGPIPSSIGNLRLTKLVLSQNGFEGSIPTSIRNLPLLQLNLSYNKLQGNIPIEVFSVTTMTTCALSYNNLEGPIPPEVSNLKQLAELHLSSNKLSGEIPSTIRECQGLQTIKMDNNLLTGNISRSFGTIKGLVLLNLSHNNLSGSIPIELGNLHFLAQLDLSYNHLEGEVPISGVFENATAVSLNGNWDLCGGEPYLHMPSCHHVSPRARRQYYLIRVLIPIFGFMSLILLIYFILLEKKIPRSRHVSSLSLGEHFPKVSYEDLVQATGNFSESNLVGKGSYGSVYRGKLVLSKLEVAVKVLDLEMRGAERSFLSECQALRSIQHRNLLDIITVCSTLDAQGNPFKALIYEYMPNGNLDTWLHHKGDRKDTNRLRLSQRISIAVNIADALEYLHHDSGRSIIHCDVKPSNILLDADMNAHLGDFGIARFYLDSKLASAEASRDSNSIAVKGTIGYIAPEYAGVRQASTCGDVYSFGVLLLEMSTGKRPTDPMFLDGLNIVSFVEKYYPEQILHVTDASVQEEYRACTQEKIVPENAVYQCLSSLLQVGLSCTRQFPSDRINMREAAMKMRDIETTYGRYRK
ncbi:receptor kinase-like protein Xa21 [Phragmites australis]|uniref:receptor kinase-like protein Xa21 n=1 Tax=Phragmites australis TaxID=29695 RepID=UPI002D772464|nr:receptor kinase-like protein Xa21 [Phragmites australis]